MRVTFAFVYNVVMAKSSGIGGLIKWVVIVGVLFFGYRDGWPWLKAKIDEVSGGSSPAETIEFVCTVQADRANLAWGSGIGRFVNPPVDTAEWSSFRSQVDAGIRQARSSCSCAQPSCSKAREALSELDRLIMTFDTSIRNGTPPGMDLVARQDAIDTKIEHAVTLAKSGS